MLGHDRPGLNPPRGESTPGSDLPAGLAEWRRRPVTDQSRAIWGDDAPFTPHRDMHRDRLRVGFWSPCLGLGGAEAWQLTLAKAMGPRIARAGAVVIEGRGASTPKMVAELSRFMPVGYGLDAARVLAAESDVIISWAVVDVDALLEGLESPPGVVMTCHFPGESPWGAGTSDLLRGVDQFVAVSGLALEAMPQPLKGQARVIWNAVDPDRIRVNRRRAAIRGGWHVPPDALVAGYLGRLSPEKDPGAMIRLVAELPDAWHAVLVGEGRERPTLEAEARRQAPGRVHLVGGDSAAGDVLNAFDVLIVPSWYESFGLTLAEGLWAGVPVVATRTGLAKLVPGLVREVSVLATGRELAEAVLRDRADRDATEERVRWASQFAHDRLGIERFGREWSDLLVDLAAGRREGRPCQPTDRVA